MKGNKNFLFTCNNAAFERMIILAAKSTCRQLIADLRRLTVLSNWMARQHQTVNYNKLRSTALLAGNRRVRRRAIGRRGSLNDRQNGRLLTLIVWLGSTVNGRRPITAWFTLWQTTHRCLPVPGRAKRRRVELMANNFAANYRQFSPQGNDRHFIHRTLNDDWAEYIRDGVERSQDVFRPRVR